MLNNLDRIEEKVDNIQVSVGKLIDIMHGTTDQGGLITTVNTNKKQISLIQKIVYGMVALLISISVGIIVKGGI